MATKLLAPEPNSALANPGIFFPAEANFALANPGIVFAADTITLIEVPPFQGGMVVNLKVLPGYSYTVMGETLPAGTYQMVKGEKREGPTEWTAKVIQESTDWGRLFGKLESFTEFKNGWDGYKAPSPNATAKKNSRSFLESLNLENYSPSQVVPSVVGGIGVNRWRGSKKVYVEFNNNGKVHALYSDGSKPPDVEQVQPDKIGFQVLIQRMRSYFDE